MLTRGDHAGAQRMKDRLSAIKSATTEVTVEKRDYGGHGSQNRFSNSFLRVLRRSRVHRGRALWCYRPSRPRMPVVSHGTYVITRTPMPRIAIVGSAARHT